MSFFFFSVKVFIITKIYSWQNFFIDSDYYFFLSTFFLVNQDYLFPHHASPLEVVAFLFLAKPCCGFQKIVSLPQSLSQNLNLIVSRNEIETSSSNFECIF